MASANVRLIQISDLVVGFGSNIVLKGVSLDIRRGEILGLVGASGGGKSVLLRTIIGLISKKSGKIEMAGIDIEEARRADIHAIEREWGVLFQQGALFSSLTVRQNVEFPMREYLDISESFREDVVDAKLRMVGISPGDAGKYPSELSGGMTKRVALARALALDPKIVFLDEPTSGLDPISAGDFDTLIKTLHETLGLTVFMVTHDLESLHRVCNRIVALADGQIAADGTLDEMMQSEHPWVKAYFRGERGRGLAQRRVA